MPVYRCWLADGREVVVRAVDSLDAQAFVLGLIQDNGVIVKVELVDGERG